MIVDQPGADMLGLLEHLLHQPGTLDDVGEAGIVFHVGGDGELAAGLDALDQDRFQHGTRGIDRGGVAGRTRADDPDLGVGRLWHCQRPPGGRRAQIAPWPDRYRLSFGCMAFRGAMQDTQPPDSQPWVPEALRRVHARNNVSRNIISRYGWSRLFAYPPEGSLPARLDAIDRKILKELQDDGRMTNVELSRRVGISAPPCLRRVRALEEAGYIKGYRALLDEKK